jgi:2-keto-4-pentenoate hydratase/2-oxohepta-3-ene-1,7-dioic acid hydratase in catechol pathway
MYHTSIFFAILPTMRYVTYKLDGFEPRVGAIVDGQIVDLGFDRDMVAFIAAGAPEVDRRPVGSNARLLAPLRPRSMRDFLTFRGHMENALGRLGRPIPQEWFTVPAYYKGMPDTVVGPDAEIPWPRYSEVVDHELEIACVIGKPGRDIRPEAASEHIFGWTIWNDFSARDVQTRELPLGLGPAKAKDWDGSNALGPCLVTPDEFDGMRAAMAVRVNGELWGSDNSSSMHHDFPTLIAYASQDQMLYPGDLLGSGTAAGGSGLELDRQLNPGDVVELEIEGLGTLRNIIGPKER